MQKLDAKIDTVETRLTARIEAVEMKVDVVEARLTAKIEGVDARVDSCRAAIDRLTEGYKFYHTVSIGLLVAVAAGVVLQFFLK